MSYRGHFNNLIYLNALEDINRISTFVAGLTAIYLLLIIIDIIVGLNLIINPAQRDYILSRTSKGGGFLCFIRKNEFKKRNFFAYKSQSTKACSLSRVRIVLKRRKVKAGGCFFRI